MSNQQVLYLSVSVDSGDTQWRYYSVVDVSSVLD